VAAAVRAGRSVKIPRVFHQIWVGPDPLPDGYERHRDSWLRHHPGWDLRLWTEESLPQNARRPEVYERLRNPGERSDVLRFELLSRFGGVYVDCDFECLRSIEPLLEGVELFAGYKKPGRTNNAIIGSTPGHPAVERALELIRPRTTYGVVDKEGTGPLFLDRLLAEFPDATIFGPEIFYPRTHKGRLEAYAVHHRGRAWKDAEGIRASLRKAEKKLRRARDEAERWRLACEQAEAELVLRRS
jgi:inositol phosphorylceramide mannosyltransferase catalytic subunit